MDLHFERQKPLCKALGRGRRLHSVFAAQVEVATSRKCPSGAQSGSGRAAQHSAWRRVSPQEIFVK